MLSNVSYNEFYEDGSTARKLKTYGKPEKVKNNRRLGKNKIQKNLNKKNEHKKALKTVRVVSLTLCIFTMMVIISYRYNLINEKNLKSIGLKSELSSVEANLLKAQISVEQSTNLTEIESYAKQKLGMQKPDKNQTIYVDTSDSLYSSNTTSETSGIANIFNSIKNMFKKII